MGLTIGWFAKLKGGGWFDRLMTNTFVARSSESKAASGYSRNWRRKSTAIKSPSNTPAHRMQTESVTPNLPLSPAEAAQLLLRRRTIRRSLTEWARHCGFEPAAHHRLIVNKLEAVAHGDIPRLALFLPPGSAKSTYASVLFPPWLMQLRPGWRVLSASHTIDLAERWGRRVRNLVINHGPVLGLAMSSDSQAAGRWSLTNGGEYYAAGVGTGIAGFRGNLGLIDDPVRSREDADSETIREKTWEWYLNDFVPRLVPGSAKVLIQTRWHEDDLAGRCLNHEPWDVVSLPAQAIEDDQLGRAPGEWLWTDGDYGYGAQLEDLKRTMPGRTWSALYQQAPAPDEGDYFRRAWFRSYDTLPAQLAVYGASDYAVTSDGGDYTVHVVVGVDPDGLMYVLDLWRQQASSDVWIEAWCDIVRRWKPREWAEEGGQINAGVGPFIQRRAIETKSFTYRRQFAARGDKAVRAQSIRGRMAMQGLYLPAVSDWRAAFEAELLTFPANKHDDQVDALGLIGQLLDHLTPAKRPEDRIKPVRNIYTRENGHIVRHMPSTRERIDKWRRSAVE